MTDGRLKDNVCPPGFVPLGEVMERKSRARNKEIPARADIEALVRLGFDQDEVTAHIAEVGVRVHRQLMRRLTDLVFPPDSPKGDDT